VQALVERRDLGGGNRVRISIAEIRPDVVDHCRYLLLAQGRRRPAESDGMPGANAGMLRRPARMVSAMYCRDAKVRLLASAGK